MGFDVWKQVSGSNSNGKVSGVRSSKSTKASNASGAKKSKTSRKKRKSVPRLERQTNRDLVQQERKWRAESDLDALTRASEILDSPERVKAAQGIAREKERAAREAAESVNKIGKGE